MIQVPDVMIRALFAGAVLLHAAVWHRSAGRSQRRGSTFFGVRVEAGFAESDAGRTILQGFHWRLWLSALALAAVAAVQRAGAIYFAVLGAGLLAFAMAHRETRLQACAMPAPTARVASLANEPESPWLTVLDWLAMTVPLAAPIATLLFLAHYGSGFSTPFLSKHYFAAVFALCGGLMCSANQICLRYYSRPSDWAPDSGASHKFRTYSGVMMAAVFTVMTAGICALTLMDFRLTVPWLRHWSMSGYFAITFPVQALLLIGVWRLRGWLSRHLAIESVDPMPDACWKWGIFYFNRQDPALVVPMRSGIGASHNYARPSVCVVTVVLFALLIAAGLWSIE